MIERRLRQRPVAIVRDDAVGRNAEERGAVQRVLRDQRAGRHRRLVDRDLGARAQQQIFDALAIQHPVVAKPGANAMRRDDVLGLVALRIELDADAHPIELLFAVRVIVAFEAEDRSLLQDLRRAVREDVGVVAGAVLDQVHRVADVRSHAEAQAVGVGAFGQIDVDVRVVHGPPRVGNDLHPLHVAILGQAGIDVLFGNEVGTAAPES